MERARGGRRRAKREERLEDQGTSNRPLHLRTVGVGSVGSSFLTMLRRELLMLLPLLCSLRGAAAANTSSGCTVTLDGAKAAQW